MQKHPCLGDEILKDLRIFQPFLANFCFYPLFSIAIPVTSLDIAIILFTSQVFVKYKEFQLSYTAISPSFIALPQPLDSH